MRVTSLALIVSVTMLSSCSSMLKANLTLEPSPEAAAIKETVMEADVGGCTLLGEVEGVSILGGVAGDRGQVSLNNALVDAKEKAAALGASHLLITGLKKASDVTFEDSIANLAMDIKPRLGGSAISGGAYEC